MSVRATNEYLYNVLVAATADDVGVYQGLQEQDDEGSLKVPAVIFQRVGSRTENTLDNGIENATFQFNVLIAAEYPEEVTDMEDAIRNAIGNDDEFEFLSGGVDTAPTKDDEVYVRIISVEIANQIAEDTL